MKKIISMTFMLLMAFAVSAQKRVIDRNLVFNGPLLAYTKAETPSKENLIRCAEGTEWYLENQRVGENNHVSFWIQTPDGRKTENRYWHGNDVAILMNKEDGKKYYFVYDDTFIYVDLAEWENGYLLQLYTKEK